MPSFDEWRGSFLKNLESAKGKWGREFEDAMDSTAASVFEEFSSFLSEHGFQCQRPRSAAGRRAFKLEMSENAYVLLTFFHEGVTDVRVKCEYFTPPGNASESESRHSLSDLNRGWFSERFQQALDRFVGSFGGRAPSPRDAELLTA